HPVPLPRQHSFPTRRSSDLPRENSNTPSTSTPTDRKNPSRKEETPTTPAACTNSPPTPRSCTLWIGLVAARGRPFATWVRPIHPQRSEEHTSELQSRFDLVCRHLLEKKQPT